MSDHVIIVAAGRGSRMQSDLPKQFLEIAGRPVIVHTIGKFHTYNPNLNFIIVIHPEYESFWNDDIARIHLPFNITTIIGGAERFDSVKKGLAMITDEHGIVAIHDAVRPCVSLRTIENCFDVARTKGNAVPAIRVSDSMRIERETKNVAVDRGPYRLIQTPQCFELSLLKKAYNQSFQPYFTDDASVVEALGENINLIEGNPENIKITTPSDLRIAAAILSV